MVAQILVACERRHNKLKIFDIAIFKFREAISRQSKVQISVFCQNPVRRDRFMGALNKFFFCVFKLAYFILNFRQCSRFFPASGNLTSFEFSAEPGSSCPVAHFRHIWEERKCASDLSFWEMSFSSSTSCWQFPIFSGDHDRHCCQHSFHGGGTPSTGKSWMNHNTPPCGFWLFACKKW